MNDNIFYLVADMDALDDMFDSDWNMNSLADYDAAIAIGLEAAYKIADRYIMEQDVTQAVVIPIDDSKIFRAMMQPVHDVFLWPEDEPEPVLPEPVYPDCEDYE